MSYMDKKIKRTFTLSSDLTLEIIKWETCYHDGHG